MPDKWEYPWYAAWDLAFHMIPFAQVDPDFAKEQLVLFLREWYMHPNGQLPAYEFDFGRRQPAGPRLGLLARLQDDRRPRPPRPRIPVPRASRSCSSISPGGSTARTSKATTSSPAAFSAWTTSASSIAPSRCRPAAISSRRTARPGWRSIARRCFPSRSSWPATTRPTKTWPPSSSSTSSPSPTP